MGSISLWPETLTISFVFSHISFFDRNLISDQFQMSSGFEGSDAVGSIELAIEVFEVAFDGVEGDDEVGGDLRIGAPGSQEGEDALLLCGERFEQGAANAAGAGGEGVEDGLGISAQGFVGEGG